MHRIIQSDFVFAEARHIIKGNGFIVSTREPFETASILTFETQAEYLTAITASPYPVAAVSDYRILLKFIGYFDSEARIKLTEGKPHEKINHILGEMVEFYMNEKINRHLGRYKRFRI